MRRVIVFLTSLTLALLLGAGTARADTVALKGPLPATIKARTVAPAGAPGALVPIEGTLRDAQRRPLTGVPVIVSLPGTDAAHSTQESLTGSGGSFEAYVPLPESLPASGTVELTVSFAGSEQAAASSLVLPVRVVAPQQSGPGDQPAAQPESGPAAQPAEVTLPSSGIPLIDQLIGVAGGVFAVMVLLFGVGAFLRRRRG
ncbi:MAG: hypothetical protein QM582_05340 [Micropruina sp.]|uniref:carboxypeptidase-like regulatory domain-containing protein n=1 Tax=Micropruina sp. TaxID=2737536 RepID=UPI0039E66E16